MRILIDVLKAGAESLSAIVGGRSVTNIGPVDISKRASVMDGTFTVSYINRMNNQSVSVHKFDKNKYTVEMGSPNGVDFVTTFKTIEPAAQLALMNTDVTRLEDDVAIKARRTFLVTISEYEGRAKALIFPQSAWKLSRYRNKQVVFDFEGQPVQGTLMMLLPPSGAKCVVRPQGGDNTIIESSQVWVE